MTEITNSVKSESKPVVPDPIAFPPDCIRFESKSNKDVSVTIHPTKLDHETYQPFNSITASFRINYDLQQDGRGPFPQFEDFVDQALAKVKVEILRQHGSKLLQ